MSEQVWVGPVFFEYDEDRCELYIGQGEEIGAMMEGLDAEEWRAFVKAASS